MPRAMILAIQDQRLRDLRRRVWCIRWGGVEELGKFRHGGGKGSGAGGRRLAQANGVTKAGDSSCVKPMASGSALCRWIEMVVMKRCLCFAIFEDPDSRI